MRLSEMFRKKIKFFFLMNPLLFLSAAEEQLSTYEKFEQIYDRHTQAMKLEVDECAREFLENFDKSEGVSSSKKRWNKVPHFSSMGVELGTVLPNLKGILKYCIIKRFTRKSG
ncbi:MAG: hypothetical protein HEEMFOPI_01569 [Holosporales bacterium]